jgi:hypothetical protein
LGWEAAGCASARVNQNPSPQDRGSGWGGTQIRQDRALLRRR